MSRIKGNVVLKNWQMVENMWKLDLVGHMNELSYALKASQLLFLRFVYLLRLNEVFSTIWLNVDYALLDFYYDLV